MDTPADLADLLECEHRSVLNQALAAGLPGAPRPGPGPDQPEVRRGRAAGAALLARVRGEGRDVGGIDGRGPGAAAKATEAAVRAGVPVIHRAVVGDSEFSGRADFLVRDGEGRYEVYAAKPARQAKPAAVVELTACADAVRRAGWPAGPHLHLVLGDGSTRTLRIEDFLPLVDRLRTRSRGRAPELPARLWADERPACAGCRFAQHCSS